MQIAQYGLSIFTFLLGSILIKGATCVKIPLHVSVSCCDFLGLQEPRLEFKASRCVLGHRVRKSPSAGGTLGIHCAGRLLH